MLLAVCNLSSKRQSCGANSLGHVDVAPIGIDCQEGIRQDYVVYVGDRVLWHLDRLFEGQGKI